MTDHIHTEIVPGCFRCELSRDEAEAFIEEDRADAQAAWVRYRDQVVRDAKAAAPVEAWDVGGATRRKLRRREFIAGFMAGRRS